MYGMKLVSMALAAAGLAACGARPAATDRRIEATGAPVVVSVAAEKSGALDRALAGPDAETLGRADASARDKGTTEATKAVRAHVTLSKRAIFDREFLWGVDLQHSSGSDAEYELINQAISLGHVPAHFRRLGDTLQLLADQSRLFESDINHPELLLAQYEIVAEHDDSLEVVVDRAGTVVNELYNGRGSPAPKETWLRSLTWVEDGSYLLQETGLLLQDGTVETFIESVFPRSALVRADFPQLLNDASLEPLAERFRFLSNESVYLPYDAGDHIARRKTQVATRYDIANGKTIDFYVTRNIPDKFLPAMKSGIEGWNRYFEAEHGRAVMRFVGRLPQGVALGDPRYNVVEWDSVEDAGAAYESQAADPISGVQSHSLIYMPYAWYNIGAALWHRRVDGLNGVEAERAARTRLEPKGAALLGRGRRALSCVRTVNDLAANADQVADEILGQDDATSMSADEFGMRILVATLFHEVGHSLGLAHNFKASLAFDGTKPVSAENPTTWSSMDYNYYQHELDLFEEVGGTEGPKLEYDRQIISALYGDMSAVSAADKVIPACNDDEADATAGGVDPLCQRYDSEANPSHGVTHAWGNFANATGAGGFERKTLAEALIGLEEKLGAKLSDPATGADRAALEEASAQLGAKVGDLVRFYASSGAQSVRGNLISNDKAIRVWSPIDPASLIQLDESSARRASFAVLSTAVAVETLPEAPRAAAAALADKVAAAVKANPNAGETEAARQATGDAAKAAFSARFEALTEAALARLRTGAASLIGSSEESPFALRWAADRSGDVTGFEDWSAAALAQRTLAGLAQADGRGAERAAAAATLASFRGLEGDAGKAVDDTEAAVRALVTAARQTGDQELVAEGRALLKALAGG